VVIEDSDTKRGGISLKRSLRKECLFSLGGFLEVDKREPAKVVDKDSGDLVALLEEVSFVLTDESRYWGLKLIHGDTATRFGDCSYLVRLSLCSPRSLCSFSI
jgi:hypothetical protein